MFDGQSLGYTPFIAAQAYPAKFMALAHPGVRHVVTNLPGTTYAQRDPGIKGRTDYLFDRAAQSVLIDDGGSYDIEDGFGNMTAAQILTTKSNYTAARRAAGADKIVGITIPPANILTGDEETIRQTVNVALLLNPATYGYDQIVDVGGVPALQNTADPAVYYDGVHWTNAATTIVAQTLADAGV